MTAMICPANDQLKAFCLGKLPEEQSDELLAHISDCRTCQAELETVKDDGDSLITKLRQPDELAECDLEPACQRSILRALDALSAGDGSTQSRVLPSVIGEYEILRPLGSGGMGHVHLARHTKLGRQVALKILATNRLGDSRANHRFATEMLAVGRLSHPNVVSAYDAREVDGMAVLVTEFIDGVDLGRLVQRVGPLNIADACEIARQVAVALDYTSHQGFVHRDVKPSNIMLGKNGEVKLLDLGLARLQCGDSDADVTGTGQTLGTADYIAPEQVTDSSSVDVRADIYSLGCTLFKLLTGRAPFADDRHVTAFSKLTAHVSTAPPNIKSLRGEIPEQLSRLIHAMLAKSTNDRPQTPSELAHSLTQFIGSSNLKELVRTSEGDPVGANQFQVRIDGASGRQSRTVLNRSVPLTTAVLAAVVSLVLGICLGVLITIKYPDGRKVVIEAPTGSEVAIQTQTSNETPVEKEKQDQFSDRNAATSQRSVFSPAKFSPMSMGILLNNDTHPELFARATAILQDSSTAQPVITDVGTWYPIYERVRSRGKVQRIGMDWVLVCRNPEYNLTWDELSGNVGATFSGNKAHLSFSDKLADKLTKLSSENLGQEFALILGGRVVYAATIITSFDSTLDLSDAHLSKEEIKYLNQCLNGGAANLELPKIDTQQDSLPNADQSAGGALTPRLDSKQVPVSRLPLSESNLPLSTNWEIIGGGSLPATASNSEQLPRNLELLWTANLGGAGFEGSPIIANGMVYLASVDGRVCKLELATGALMWKIETKHSFKAPGAYSRQRVFFGDEAGNVRAFDAETGKLVWEETIGGEINSGATFFGNNLLIPSQDGILYCLSQETGSKVWEYKTSDQLRSTPAIFGNRAYLGGCDGHLHVVDLTTGKAAAEPIPLDGPTGSTASISGTRVFIPTHSGTIFAFDLMTGKQVWKFADQKLAREFRNSAAVANGMVIASGGDRQVFALQQATGVVRWQATFPKGCDSSPFMAHGDVVFAADGCLRILDVDSGRETAYFEFKGNLLASPAISQGKLVVASDKGSVYCIGTKQSSDLLSPAAALSKYLESFKEGLQALFEAISSARSPANIQVDLELLADKLAFVSTKSPKARSEMLDALAQVWPINGIRSVAKGVPTNASWLLAQEQTAYTFSVDYATLLPDVQRVVDSISGQVGVYTEVVKGVAADPKGPQIDLVRQVIEYLGTEIVVIFDSQPLLLVSFSVRDAQNLRPSLERLVAKEPSLGFQIIGQYVVIGDVKSVDNARVRFESKR